MTNQGVFPEHIDRIAAFVNARIDEQFDADQATRYFDKDPVARSLRALSRVVGEIRSRRVLAERNEPELATAVTLAMTFAWGELATIAKEWEDHPDYLPEFALLAHELEGAPVAEEATQGITT
ncbi:hypothetical protein [Streptomyces bluensis]|uniref:hypothetical protein n=1 Tax=Streptomyces bluensis TaxID=33897 RepID=UPI00331A5AAD